MATLEETKSLIRSLLVSTQKTLNINQLNKDFKEMEGRYIPYHLFGFRTLEEMLKSMPDTVKLNYVTDRFGNNFTNVQLVLSENIAHLDELVMSQRKNQRMRGPVRKAALKPQPMRDEGNSYTPSSSYKSSYEEKSSTQMRSAFQSVADIPFYGTSKFPTRESIPWCTLKNDDYKKAEETDNNSSNNKIYPLSFAVHHDTDTYQKDYPKLRDAYKKKSMMRDNTSQHRAMEFIPINSSNKTSMNREIQQEEAASYMPHNNNFMARETEYLPPTEEDTPFNRTSMSSFSMNREIQQEEAARYMPHHNNFMARETEYLPPTEEDTPFNRTSMSSFSMNREIQQEEAASYMPHNNNFMARETEYLPPTEEDTPFNRTSMSSFSMNREITQKEEAARYMPHHNNFMARETEYLPPTEEDTPFNRTSMSSFSQRSNYMDPHYSPRDFLPQIGHQSQRSAGGANIVDDAAFRPTQHAQISSYAAATPSSADVTQKRSDHPTQSDHVEFSEMESVVESMYDRYRPSVLQVFSSVAAKKQGSRSASSISEHLAREMQKGSYSRNVSESSTIKKEYTFGTYKS